LKVKYAFKQNLRYLHILYGNRWRRVICSKFICSKKLLDTKISIAQHCLSRWQKYMNLLENQKSMAYMSCRADASFRPKCTTARIATAQQKHWKMSTARIKKSWKVWNMYGSSVKKSWKFWNMYGSLVKKQSKLG
jgi:hypothetical protein